MSHVSTLLAALCAEPSDSTAWLALADCLEEDGHEDQAELLRTRQALLDEGISWRQALETRLAALLARGVRPVVPEVENSVGMRLALVPPGSFWMGSPEGEAGRHPDEDPRHRVRLSHPFFLGVTPVTQRQYKAVMRHNPSHFRHGGEGAAQVRALDTATFPVERVSWYDSVEFCERLGELPLEAASGRRYRLPTEAEWEYACRACTSTMFHYGDTLSSFLANIDGNLPEGDAPRAGFLGRPTTVASYPPNAFGLHDMHGNVWEWCQDWFDDHYYGCSPAVDPGGPPESTRRALRGGGWVYGARISRSAYRYRYEPEARHNDFGLRVVMEIASRERGT